MQREIALLAMLATTGCGEVIQHTGAPSSQNDASISIEPDARTVSEPPDTGTSITPGQLGGGCLADARCDSDLELECVNDICVEPVACPSPTTIYLNFDGGLFGRSETDDPIDNFYSKLYPGLDGSATTATAAAWGVTDDSFKQEMLSRIRQHMQPFHVFVTRRDPGPTEHYEIVFTSSEAKDLVYTNDEEENPYPGTHNLEIPFSVGDGCNDEQRIGFIFENSNSVENETLEHYTLKVIGRMVGGTYIPSEADSIMSTRSLKNRRISNETIGCGDAQCQCPDSDGNVVDGESIFSRFEHAFGRACSDD